MRPSFCFVCLAVCVPVSIDVALADLASAASDSDAIAVRQIDLRERMAAQHSRDGDDSDFDVDAFIHSVEAGLPPYPLTIAQQKQKEVRAQ